MKPQSFDVPVVGGPGPRPIPWTPVWGVILAAVAVFLLATIRPGQPWDGDAELYIIDALSILHGGPYGAGGYVFNPDNPINPAAYPAGFPLLLLPLLMTFGLNYLAIKVALVLCFIGFLALLTRIARDRLDPVAVALLIAMLGFNPFVWHFKDVVFSEFPFLLLSYGALFLVDRIDRAGADGGTRWHGILGAAMMLAAACLVRAAGIAVIAAVAGLVLLRGRRLWRPGLAVLVLACVLILAVNHVFPADVGGYGATFDDWELSDLPSNLVDDALSYLQGFVGLLGGNHGGVPGGVVSAVWLVLAAIGMVQVARNRLSVFELFFGAYMALLVAYPMTEERMRYALPVLPLLLLYGLSGIAVAAASLDRWRGHGRAVAALFLLLTVALAFVYAPQFGRQPKGRNLSVEQSEARQLYDEVMCRVPADALIIATYPTVIALHTGRRATAAPEEAEAEDFWDFVADSGAGWLIRGRRPMEDDARPLMKVLRPRLQPVYRNALFVLYRIRPAVPDSAVPRLAAARLMAPDHPGASDPSPNNQR
ncbi:MAG: hypothetical protein P4M00_14605 [Azospirillaceae bacterium]|nr:hypothetical protein [Azospirillaceae bacterium]